MIVGDELVTRDARLDDAAAVEIRPVISGGAAMKCRTCRGPAVDRRPPPQRRRSAVTTSCTTARSRSAGRSTSHRMIGPGERVLVAVSGGKDSLALWDLLGRARLRGRRPLPRARHRRVLRRVGRLRARRSPSERGLHAARGRPRHRLRLRRPRRGGGHAPRAVRRVRALEAPPLQRAPRSTAATTSSPPATTSTTRPRCCSATCCGGRPGYLGRQHPVLPAAPGFVRKVKPLVRLGEREMAAYCVLRGIDYQVEECPMAAGNRHLGYKELLNGLEDALARLEGRVPRSASSNAATSASPRRAEDERAALVACAGRAARPTTRSTTRLRSAACASCRASARLQARRVGAGRAADRSR